MNHPSLSIVRRRSRRGSAIVMALGFALIVGLIVGMVLTATERQTRNVYRTQILENSLGGARAVLNGMTSNIIYVVNNRPPQMQGVIANLNNTIKSIRPQELRGYELVRDNRGRLLTYIRDLGPNDFTFRTITEQGSRWYGYTTTRLDYELVTFVREDSETADRLNFPGAGLRKRVTIDYIPLYQFAIFYHPDLELHPGPEMDVRGPVHCNGTMWLSARNRLDFHDKVTAVGQIRDYDDFTRLNLNLTDTRSPYWRYPIEAYDEGNAVRFKNAAGNFVNAQRITASQGDSNGNLMLESTDANWATKALEFWNGNVRDRAQGTRIINPPLPSGTDGHDMIERARPSDPPEVAATRFENRADIIISGDPGRPSTWRIRDRAGNNINPTMPDGSSILSEGRFYDGQQQTVVRTIEVDLGKLAQRSDIQFTNGVIYASTTPGPGDTWQSPTTWNQPGVNDYMPAISVKNAASVPRNVRNGFTFATDRPLYTIGNFNTQNKATAVLAADSITVLSRPLTLDEWRQVTVNGQPAYERVATGNTREPDPNTGVKHHNENWSNFREAYRDAQGRLQVRTTTINASLPQAQPTSTNAILLMGNTPSQFTPDGKRYTQSGGAHNVIRYLEKWGSGTMHTFLGSIIVLFASEQATQPWRNQSGGTFFPYYDPPSRNYVWDNSLQNAEPPPGMPVFIDVYDFTVSRVSKQYAMQNRPSN
ncbi:MAG: hypothetical protein N2111_12635 [Candidatus Sumerlaeaceae bacterium]|nr:hypothetical protein [Candidatus Sumerlaeaceae bacterium]